MDSKNDTAYFRQWVKGIPYELAFWNNTYRWKGAFEGLMNWSRLGKSLQLEGVDVESMLASVDHPVVLDVGCGMSYAKGDRITVAGVEKMLEVHYIDPLADYYNDIKRRHRRDVPDIQFGMMEYLTAAVEPRTADLVIIHNALDHSAHPMKGVFSALAALKTGGCLYLNHHPNEAETEHYKGFHQYNICLDERGRCLIWNKDERFVLDEVLAPFATIENQTLENGFVVSVIRKTAEPVDNAFSPLADNRELAHLLFEQVRHGGGLWHAFSMKMRYWWYNSIQFFVQALPYEKRMQLRKLIYRKR